MTRDHIRRHVASDEALAAALASWGGYDNDNPFPVFAAARERGPVHEVTLVDGHKAWLIVGYREAKSALMDPRFSKNMQAAFELGDDVAAEGLPGPAFAKHMLAVDPPDHTRLRRLVSNEFTPRRVESLRPHIERIVGELLDCIDVRDPHAPVDLIEALAFPLPFTVICELLGVPDDVRPALGESFVGLLSPITSDHQWAAAKQCSDHVIAMLETLVADKQAQRDGALISALIDARDGDCHLDQQELLSTIFQLIVAGHDTVSSTIGNGALALLTHPDELTALMVDSSRLPDVIEELLRFDPPAPHATFRFATEDVDISGVTIPKGAQVLVSLGAANRDEVAFTHPDVFDIRRDEARHLAFGHGPHYCLGASLARLETSIAFEALFRRFPALTLAAPVESLH